MKLAAIIGLPAIALAIAGCGGSSTTSSTSASPSSTRSSAPATSAASTTTGPAAASTTTGPAATSTTTAPAATSSTAAAAGVQIATRALPGLGVVLVNGQGDTLYTFAPDKAKKVTCVDSSCTSVWPPLALKGGKKPGASGGVKASLLGSDPGPSGTRVVTYAGWPLYTYVADTSPGAVTGQALNLNGGPWYVINPAGTVIHKTH